MPVRSTFVLTSSAISLLVASPAHSATIRCFETSGGWCEATGRCYSNTLPPVTITVTTAAILGDGQEGAAQFQQCRDGDCGMSFPYRAYGTSTALQFQQYHGEILEIDRATGNFAMVSWQIGNGPAAGVARVNSTFGHCIMPDS